MANSALFAQAAAAATVSDQTAAPAAFEYQTPPEGFTVARFVGYVEVGKQPQRAFEGVEKPDAPTVRLTFELNGPAHCTEYEKDGEKRVRTNIIRTALTISAHEKSGFSKLLKKMAAGRENIKHMAEMLGEGFLIKITHSKSKDGKKTYANMKEDGVWNISAPAHTDVITNQTTILDVPEATVDGQLLLWDMPTQEQWDSVFIDGSTEREVEGKTIVTSKNFIQEQALSASNFVGSPLEALVAGAAGITDEIVKDAPVADAPKEEAPAAADPLAALGL